MKKTTWKKIVSVLLVAALVIGGLQMNARKVSATVAAPTASMNNTTTDANKPSATYTVTGGSETDSTFKGKKTDIVLAIDLSNSMNEGGRLASAKTAALSFVSKLLNDSNTSQYVSIAVVSYGTTAKTECGLTKDITALNTAINGLRVSGSNQNGGTNIDDALEEVEAVFEGIESENKVLVLLSDGEPTFANGTSSEYVWVETDPFDVDSMDEYDWDLGGFHLFRYYEAADGKRYCRESWIEWFKTYYRYYVEEERLNSTIIGPGNKCTPEVKQATLDEAARVEKAGITAYTVLFANTDPDALEVMKGIATTEDKYYSSTNTADAITEVYNNIGDKITNTIYAGNNAYIAATLSPYVDIDEAKLQEGVVEYDAEKNAAIVYAGRLDQPTKTTAEVGFKVKPFVTADYLKNSGDTNIKVVTDAETGIEYYTLPVTSLTQLHYQKDEEWQTPVDVTNIITIKYPVSSVVDYTINYYVDYEEVVDELITTETGTAFVGDTVNASKTTVAQIVEGKEGYPANYYTLKTGQTFEFEITATGNEFNVYVTHNKATVYFYDMKSQENGGEPGNLDHLAYTDSHYYYGDTVSLIDRNAASPVVFTNAEVASEAAVIYTWLGTWRGVPDVIEMDEYTILADYDLPTEGDLYTISYVNYDDSPLAGGVTQRDGTTTTAPAGAERGEDEQYTYTFKEWQLVGGTEEDVVAGGGTITVTGDATYKAVYTPVTRKYTATFVANGVTVDTQEKIPYGEYAVEPAEELTADLTTAYKKFKGWDKDVATTQIKGDTTFTALFEDRYYTITYYDGDRVLAANSIKAGATLAKFDEFPYDTTKYVLAGYTLTQDGTEFVTVGDTVFKDITRDIDIFLHYKEKPAPVVTIIPEPTDRPIIVFIEDNDDEPETTVTPTEEPSPEPTAEPEVELEETETPEGAPEEEEVEVDVIETPEGAPEEEVDIDEIETPQSDLPQTGVASTGVFFGIGAACIMIGGLTIFGIRRKEDM